MRRAASFLLLLVLAATCVPAPISVTLTPATALVYVGEDAVLRARRGCCGRGEDRFEASVPAVALIQGRLEESASFADVHVLGLTPGFTRVRVKGNDEGEIGKIEVVCGPESPIRAAAQPEPIAFGESVTLHVISQSTAPRVFSWYLGRTGDKSQPLPFSGTDVIYTPERAGTMYVWVSADSACSSTAAEFRIDVTPDRNRAVRH